MSVRKTAAEKLSAENTPIAKTAARNKHSTIT
jgi:hypothetical protein